MPMHEMSQPISSVSTIHPRQVAMHDCQAEISLEKINAHARPGFGEVRWIDEEIFQHWGVAEMREVFEKLENSWSIRCQH